MASPGDDRDRVLPGSFIHSARREQLVRSAIAVIAELGAERASVVRIARHAGVSRGVVAYHFRDLADLHGAVVREVYRLGGEQLHKPVAEAATPREALLTFVADSVDFYTEFPEHIAALSEIFAAARRARDSTEQHQHEADNVVTMLRAGQAAGQFRAFDASVMARIVRGVLDSAIAALGDNTIDVALLRAELVTAVDAMTAADTNPST
ncbi:TetR/AcrR family transcriptional regulator [Kribbella sp. DT2]|uniref:TetR/AcrR family transcriptional regulator n=1 Tax=Kribbella sp. DT2 TaxID=3393427 RepID=UPI003CF8413A